MKIFIYKFQLSIFRFILVEFRSLQEVFWMARTTYTPGNCYSLMIHVYVLLSIWDLWLLTMSSHNSLKTTPYGAARRGSLPTESLSHLRKWGRKTSVIESVNHRSILNNLKKRSRATIHRDTMDVITLIVELTSGNFCMVSRKSFS